MSRLRNDHLKDWLTGSSTSTGHYTHTRLDEVDSEAGRSAFADAVEHAHEDAVRWLEEMIGIDLNPLGSPDDSTADYPSGLHTITLQGYLGEILAGVLAENHAPHGFHWEVPAFLFRYHNAAFESLERRLHLGADPTRIPGRTGDDCIAFLRDEDGRIIAWLNCEAKCSRGHGASLISEGHEQLARPLKRAASALQLIETMKRSRASDSDDWVDALRVFRHDADTARAAERADLFVYVCGQRPINRSTWLPKDAPHPAYSATFPIEAVEIHLDDVLQTLKLAYAGHELVDD